MHIRAHTRACAGSHTLTQVHARTHIHTNTHTHTYTHTHTHIYLYLYIYIVQLEGNSNVVKLTLYIYFAREYCYIFRLADGFLHFRYEVVEQHMCLEERYAIKFCFKLGNNATETYGMFQTAFRPSCRNRASVFEWHKRFKEGRELVRDDERCERSKEVNTPELIGKRLGLGLLCWGF